MKKIFSCFFICLLILFITAGAFAQVQKNDILIADFEGDSYGEWQTTGSAFGRSPDWSNTEYPDLLVGFQGKGLATSYHGWNKPTGTLTSPYFTIQHDYINFLISGGHYKDKTCMVLIVDGQIVRRKTGETNIILIAGMGPVGLGGIIIAKYKNCRVIAISKNQYRSELAMELGAERVFDPTKKNVIDQIREYTGGYGADISIECSGQSDAQKMLIASTRRNGRIAFIGESSELTINVSEDLIRTGLILYGIWHYNYNGIQKLFELVKNSKEKLNKMITHTYSLSEIETAWNLQLTKQCGKVILHP